MRAPSGWAPSDRTLQRLFERKADLFPIRPQGVSMLPTYSPGEFSLVNRLAYLGKTPSRGDVVAIMVAGPHVLYVKRVVGLPG